MTATKKKWELKDSIVLLRMLIGWHFLYEGILKVYNPDWTAFGYLASAQGFMKPVFNFLADSSIIGTVDFFNKFALVFVGLALLLGIFERLGAYVAVCLLAMYYLAHPPFPWLTQVSAEGSYWFVNKNLIELAACLVILQLPTADYFGLKRLMNKK